MPGDYAIWLNKSKDPTGGTFLFVGLCGRDCHGEGVVGNPFGNLAAAVEFILFLVQLFDIFYTVRESSFYAAAKFVAWKPHGCSFYPK